MACCPCAANECRLCQSHILHRTCVLARNDMTGLSTSRMKICAWRWRRWCDVSIRQLVPSRRNVKKSQSRSAGKVPRNIAETKTAEPLADVSPPSIPLSSLGADAAEVWAAIGTFPFHPLTSLEALEGNIKHCRVVCGVLGSPVRGVGCREKLESGLGARHARARSGLRGDRTTCVLCPCIHVGRCGMAETGSWLV